MLTAKFASTDSGILAEKIGWIEYGEGFRIVTGGGPVHIQNALPEGFTIEFDIEVVSDTKDDTPFVAVLPSAYQETAFDIADFMGIEGKIALYPDWTKDGMLDNTIVVSDVVVKNSDQKQIFDYYLTVVDAESEEEKGLFDTEEEDFIQPSETLIALSVQITDAKQGFAFGIVITAEEQTETAADQTIAREEQFVVPEEQSVELEEQTAVPVQQAPIQRKVKSAFSALAASPREQAVTDLIESVALEQVSLSHILNAEGEKIQNVIQTADVTPEELLAVNQSTANLIKQITKLETLLYRKLEKIVAPI